MSHPPTNRLPSKLAGALHLLGDDTFHRITCAGIAAGTVVARVLGMTVRWAYAARPGEPGPVGGCIPSTDGVDAQHVVVHLSAIALGSSRALPPHVHPLTAAAVEEITGQGAHRQILQILDQGCAVWRRQAQADALALLDEPKVWARVRDVADALAEAGPGGLCQKEIETLVGDPGTLTARRTWTPDLTGLEGPHA